MGDDTQKRIDGILNSADFLMRVKNPVEVPGLIDQIIEIGGYPAFEQMVAKVESESEPININEWDHDVVRYLLCDRRQTHAQTELGGVLSYPEMNLLWNTVNCEGDATAFLLHGVSYLNEEMKYFVVPPNVVYIQSVKVGINLSSVADSVILDFMENRTAYIKKWLATGSTGNVAIDYLLAECIIYFPGDRVPIRYLFGKPADNSGPPISTYYYKKDSTSVDKTKFRYMIMQLNNIAPGGAGKYFMTNESIIDAIVARAAVGGEDYAEHKFHLVFVAACSSVRSSIRMPADMQKTTTADGSEIPTCLAVYQDILKMEQQQMFNILTLLSRVFARQYEEKRHELKLPEDEFYVSEVKVPNIDFDTEKGSIPKPWAVFGFGLYFDTLRFSHSDNVPKTLEGIFGAYAPRGSSVSDNIRVSWLAANSRKAPAPSYVFARSPSLVARPVDPTEEAERAKYSIVDPAKDEILRTWLHIKLKGQKGKPFTIYLQPKTGSIAPDNSLMDKSIGVVGEGREEKYVGGAGGAGGPASGGGSWKKGGALRKRKCTHYKHKRTARKRTRRAPRKHCRSPETPH